MPARLVAFIVAFAPLLTIHASYFIAASYGHIDWCFPYGIDCRSISSTGRNPPESFLFKPMMTLSAVFMLFYWRLCIEYIQLHKIPARKRIRAIGILGVLAPLFLIVYSTFLGEHGDDYRLYRKIGITLGFTFTYMCQLLVTSCLLELPRRSRNIALAFRTNILLLSLGILSVLLDVIWPDHYDRVENGFEWTFALLLCVHTFLIYREWTDNKFRHSFHLHNREG